MVYTLNIEQYVLVTAAQNSGTSGVVVNRFDVLHIEH
jgi:hypothetical protein